VPKVPNKPKVGRERLDVLTITNYPEFSKTVVGTGVRQGLTVLVFARGTFGEK
jgi:hypothetical protein